MSSISPVNSVNTSASLGGVRRNGASPAEAPKLTLSPVDSVDISSEARAAETSAEKVSRVRQQLKDGTYLHPDKLDIALDRMIDQLG